MLAYLVNPVALQSYASAKAGEFGGCGGERPRRAVLQALLEASMASYSSARPTRTNELPGRVVAESFAFDQREYETVGLFESNLRKGLRDRALEFLVSQEDLLDAYCAIGASGRAKGSLANLAEILSVSIASGSKDCEVKALAQVFVEFDNYSNNNKLRQVYQAYKVRSCDGVGDLSVPNIPGIPEDSGDTQ